MSCCVASFMRRVTHIPLFGRESRGAMDEESDAAIAELPAVNVIFEQAVSGRMPNKMAVKR